MTWSVSFCSYRKLLVTFFCLFLLVVSYSQNPIVTENALPGNPSSEWSVPDFRDNRIAGFATKMSLNAGSTVRFKINVQSGASYTIKIYRIGYYGGNGARLMQNLGSFSGTVQPNGTTNTTTGMLDCSNWSESASWAIPSNAVSGLYIAKLERSGGGSNHIVFIVRNDASNSDIYVQFPDATWQAYNGYGGTSNYDGTTSWPSGHAVKVSYNRPFFPYNSLFNTDGREADWYMNAEYPMIRWLERNGYDVTYTSCNDIARNGNRILNHKIYMSLGHDEYWSKEMRDNVEAARSAGVHLAFFSGNEVYWKTRWESSDGTEDRTLVCYKEGTLADGTIGERACGSKCDGSTSEWTGLWRMGGNYDGGRPENGLTGQISWVEYPSQIEVPAFYKKIRLWRNSSVASLSSGQKASLGINTLGYEWDYEQPAFASSYPAGRFTASSTTVNSLTHKLSLYRHSSGALVFGAGTVQWSWGLDGNHWGGSTTTSTEMQQATVNLFADMGNVQPATLQSGLTQATQSSDFNGPSATISSPASGSSFGVGATVNLSGSSTDGGGGVVSSVEISTDGGATWLPATISAPDNTVTWSYSWTTGSNGNYVVRARGVDDSGNIGNATSINITVGSGGDVTPPTVSTVSPSNGATNVSTATTVTATFNESVNSSTVTTGTFQLRDGSNNLVAATVSTSGSQITLNPASSLSNSTTYTATITGGASGVKDLSNNALANNYSWSFATGAGGGGGGTTYTVFQSNNTPAVALANDGQGIELGMRFRSTQNGYINGIRYYKGNGTTGSHIGSLWNNSGTRLAQATFINETSSGWQEVLFSSPVAITAGVTYVASYYSPSGDYCATKPYFTAAVTNGPLVGLADGTDGANGLYRYTATSAFPNSSFQSSNYWVDVVFSTGSDNTPPTVSSVSPSSGATGVSINTSVTATFSEAISNASVTSSTFQLRDASNNLVNASLATNSNQITLTPASALSGSTIYTATITGGSSGVKDVAGNSLANNFSWSFTTSNTDNTPPTVTTVSPTSGATGVSIGATITAIFSETVSSSSVTTSTFQLRDAGNNLIPASVATSANQISLTPAGSLSGSAVYTATITGGSSGVKDLAGNSLVNNFSWSFTTANTDNSPPTVQSIFPANAATGVGTGTNVIATFNESISAASATTGTFQLRDANNNLVAATVSTSSSQVTLTPSVALSASTTYTATLTGGASGIKDLAGNALAGNYSWSFTTAASGGGGGTNYSLFVAGDVPQVPLANDEIGIELGMRFRVNQNGFINGIRYYKGSGASGTHLGSLWTNSGSRLAQATFTNETASGWQQVLFSNPVAITAGVTYVASYFSPSGDYAATKPYFTQNIVNGPITGLADGLDGANGLYLYTTASTFPNNSFQSSNYWVDVVFSTSSGSGSGPTVTTQPASQTVCAGSTVTFTSAATGTPTPTVQWQLSTTNGTTWTNITGANSATYSLATTTADNGEQYRAVWTNSGGTVSSSPATLTVNATPATPTVSVVNNCGNSVLSANGTTGALLWSTGATTTSITVTTGGTYSVSQTVNGCISAAGSGTAAPLNSNVAAPSVSVVNSCGSSTLTATGFTGSLLWSTGATSASITVTTAGVYTVTQTVGGCTSPAGAGTAAPISSNVAAPVVTVTNNCGNSVLTASAFTGTLLWSTGATTASITVNTAGTYTVTQTVGGCSSPAGNGIAAPKATPSLTSNLAATVTSGTTFTYTATSSITGTTFSWTRAAVTGISNIAGSGTGNISETLVNTTSAAVNVTYVYTLTANGCTNTQNVVVTVNPATAVNCSITNTTMTANFNSSSIAAGRYIWFNSSLNPGSIGTGTTPVTIIISNAVVSFTANGVAYSLPVPNGRIRFDATVLSASTQFVNNVWETVVPRSYSSYIFMNGLAYQVPVNFPGSIANVRWTATISIDRANTSLAWRWSAAVYTNFSANSGVNVKPINGSTQNPYPNSDVAGAPENFKSSVVSGARGTGGTNYTGSFTTSSSLTCSVVATRGMGALDNEAFEIGRHLPQASIDRMENAGLEAEAVPNPSNTYFSLVIRGTNNNPVTVRVLDIFGRVVERHDRIASNTILRLGHAWRSGSYFAEVIQGGERKIVRMMKTR